MMRVKINKNTLIIFSIFFLSSFIVAFRAEKIGSDASRYARNFIANAQSDRFAGSYDIGYTFLIKFLGFFSSSKYFYFFAISFLISMLLYISYKSVNSKAYKNYEYIFISMIFFSSWYITEITNGIRQGLSLSILYLALLSELKNSRIFKFFTLYFLSISFHLSSLLLFPFLIFYRFSFKYVCYVWFILLFFYIQGFNEYIIKFISSITNLGFYEEIKSHFGQSTKWLGLQIEFLLYTIFFGLLAILIFYSDKFNSLKKFFYSNDYSSEFLCKTYLILSMVYFTFGFTAYSNRFATICWFFIPFLQTTVFQQLRLSSRTLVFLMTYLPIVSFTYFISMRLELFLDQTSYG